MGIRQRVVHVDVHHRSRSRAQGLLGREQVAQMLTALKREFTPGELTGEGLWAERATEAGLSLEAFCEVAETLAARGVLGRFSTFLEHVKELSTGERVTRYNGLFHWAVPAGMEATYAEVRRSRYHRAFTLSKELDADKVSAELSQGVLRVRIPKAAHAQPRRVQVQVN